MNPEQQKREEEIFQAALDISDLAERQAYLDGACGGDPELRRSVEELLQADERAAETFQTQPDGAFPLSGERLAIEEPGDRIGRFKLLEQIGEGGFGVVFMAEQEEPVRRRVALKILKAGMDTRQVVARFEAERQALAMMDHPGIAKVFDGGATPAGRPFFVMELVRGVPITEYCDQRRLNPRRRLELFVQVCQAVQHAHQKGVIHRDLKPANILVMEQDGRAAPKVIDFGVAKALAERLTGKTLFTRFGQLLGTPAYMSPEQAGLGGLDIDTRSDIYALGTILYELLTGRPPFETKKLLEAGQEAILRTIREVEPPKPSTRLSALAFEEQRSIAAQCGLEPQKLSRLMRGELDWIVMKAIEKERARRYETASGLALDLTRHLANEPVTARPPGRVYLIRKTILRHKAAFAAVGTVMAVLLLGGVISAWQAARAIQAEHRALAEAAKSRQVAEFLEEMLAGVGPSVALGRDTTLLREILDKAAGRIDEGLESQPEVQADLRMTLAEVYSELGEYAKAEEMLRKAAAAYRRLFGNEHLELARALNGLAGVLAQGARMDEAEVLAREGWNIRKKLLGQEHPDLANSLNNLALVLWRKGRLGEAEVMFRQSLEMWRRLHGPDHVEVANALNNLGAVLLEQGIHVEAESLLLRALEIRRSVFEGPHPEVTRIIVNLAAVLSAQDRLEEAEALAIESLEMLKIFFESDHPEVALSLRRLGWIFFKQDREPEAEVMFKDAIGMYQRLSSDAHPESAEALQGLARIFAWQNKLAEAEAAASKSLEIKRSVFANDHARLADNLDTLAWIFTKQFRFAEGEAMAREAVEMLSRLTGREHPQLAEALDTLAMALSKQGKSEEAEAAAREALDLRRRLLGEQHPHTLSSVFNLAEILLPAGKLEEAEALAREVLEKTETLFGQRHRKVSASLNLLASVLYEKGRGIEGEPIGQTRPDRLDRPPHGSR
jgi:eukaryotic-like serine/threonine-protein kinase